MENEERLQAFYDACTEMANAKIIIADAKVSKILRSVVTCPQLINLVGEALVNYNFDVEFAKLVSTDAKQNKSITLPNEPYKVIAFVFSLLSSFDTHRLDLQQFIYQYYDREGLMESYKAFVSQIIIPFRDALAEWVGLKTGESSMQFNTLGTDGIVQAEMGTGMPNANNTKLKDFYADIALILGQIKETVNLDSKIKRDRLDELNITIDALLQTIEMRKLKIMNALLISLNYLLLPIKSVRFYNMELQEKLTKFYSEL